MFSEQDISIDRDKIIRDIYHFFENDIPDIKKYCDNINSLINDKSLGPKRKDHISSNRLSKICGIEWSAFSNDTNNQVLILSLITSFMIVLLITLRSVTLTS